MSGPPVLPFAAIASALGVLSHLGYFIRGEHHLQAYWLLLISITAPVALFAFLFQSLGLSVFQAAIFVTTTWWAYAGSLWMSMIVYRLFFHRLRSYHGPLLWKVSKLTGHVASITKLDNFRVLDKLHQQYGDYVRTGMPATERLCSEANPYLILVRSDGTVRH
jgi:signal transduction histidine kinase